MEGVLQGGHWERSGWKEKEEIPVRTSPFPHVQANSRIKSLTQRPQQGPILGVKVPTRNNMNLQNPVNRVKHFSLQFVNISSDIDTQAVDISVTA